MRLQMIIKLFKSMPIVVNYSMCKRSTSSRRPVHLQGCSSIMSLPIPNSGHFESKQLIGRFCLKYMFSHTCYKSISNRYCEPCFGIHSPTYRWDCSNFEHISTPPSSPVCFEWFVRNKSTVCRRFKSILSLPINNA